MADDESHEQQEDQHMDENEAKRAMEDAKRLRVEKQAQEMEEYEELRHDAREKEAQEIQELRERRERRKTERHAEEARLTELRAQEELRRKAEEEVRKKKKAEEEARNKEEKDRKKREAEERIMKAKKPNFVITKRTDSEKGPGGAPDHGILEPMNSDDMQKSKEQLEEEKRAILSQRITPLAIDGFASDKLLTKAKELVEVIRRLESDRYDLEERYKRQQYDMIELAERARQMNKGKGKRGVSSVQVDESFDRLADKFSSAPPKIQLCSKYERHTDHRTYNERAELFEKLAVEEEPPEIDHVATKVEGEEEAAE